MPHIIEACIAPPNALGHLRMQTRDFVSTGSCLSLFALRSSRFAIDLLNRIHSTTSNAEDRLPLRAHLSISQSLHKLGFVMHRHRGHARPNTFIRPHLKPQSPTPNTHIITSIGSKRLLKVDKLLLHGHSVSIRSAIWLFPSNLSTHWGHRGRCPVRILFLIFQKPEGESNQLTPSPIISISTCSASAFLRRQRRLIPQNQFEADLTR